MSTPIFSTPLDNVSTTLTVAHTSGGATITVANGSLFGSPTSSNPVRITIIRTSDSVRTHFSVTHINSNVLTVTPTDGYTDNNFAIGDLVGVYFTAGTLNDIHNAITTAYGTFGPVSPRFYAASTLTGAAADCNLATGAKIGGGTATDNATIFNALLATATATSPVHLHLDGGFLIGKGLFIPTTGNVTITGDGWHSGIYMKSGANSSAIRNFSGANAVEYDVWAPSAQQTITAFNIHISNFYINCNRGTYPSGNCNGTPDGSLTGQSLIPDARGVYTSSFWFSGIVLKGAENVHIEDMYIYDAPAYHINLYHSMNVWIDKCKIQAGDPNFSGNTDGVHVNGGCSYIKITNTWFSTGDDAVAFNIQEGDGINGNDFSVDNCEFANCASVGRLYGKTNESKRVSFTNLKGSAQLRGFVVGDESNTSGEENNHSVIFDNCWLAITGSYSDIALISIVAGCGVVHLSNCRMLEPSVVAPLLRIGNNGTNPNISSITMVDCGIHRSVSSHGACYLVLGESGVITNLSIENCKLTEEYSQAFTDVPIFINLAGTSVNHLAVEADVKGVATVINVTSSSTVGALTVKDLIHTSNAGSPTAHSIVAAGSTIPISVGRYTGTNLSGLASGTVSLTGNGLVSSQFALADALIGNNTIYRSSTQSALAYKDSSGVVNIIGVTSVGGLTAGVATIGSTGGTTAAATATDASGGTSPYTYQWYRSTASGTLGSLVSGQTTKTLSDTGLTVSTGYYYTLKYIDNVSATVYSNQILETTTSGLTVRMGDNFIGTNATSIVGSVPTIQNGSDVWQIWIDGSSTIFDFVTGGGAQSAGAGSNWGVFYPMTGLGTDQTITVFFENKGSTASYATMYFRTDVAINNGIPVLIDYINGHLVLQSVIATVFNPNVATGNFSFALNTIYKLIAVFSGTTVSISINDTPVLTNVTVPAATAPGFAVRHQQGTAGDIKFVSMNLQT